MARPMGITNTINKFSPGSFLFVSPGGDLTLRKSSAIKEVGAFEHELGFVVVSDLDVMKKYSVDLRLAEGEVWNLLTSLEIQGSRKSEFSHLFLLRGKFVLDIQSSVPQTTLANITCRLRLQSCLMALVDAQLLSAESAGYQREGGGSDLRGEESSLEGGGSNMGGGGGGIVRGRRGNFGGGGGSIRGGRGKNRGMGGSSMEDRSGGAKGEEGAPGSRNAFSRVDSKMLEKNHQEYLEEAKPANTKKSTKAAETLYNSVMEEISLTSLETTSINDLPANLNTFFRVLRKPAPNSEDEAGYYNASSLETYFQSLARTLKDNRQVDIKNDVRFHQSRETLKVKKQESAAHAEVAGKNAKKAIPSKCLAMAYSKGKLGISNPQALSATVVLGAQGGWGCRLKEETYNIQNGDLEYGTMDDDGLPEFIQLAERLTKVMRGQRREARELDKRIYADKERPETCPVRAVMEMQRRKQDFQLAKDVPLFWTCRQLKGDPQSHKYWFTSIRMGVHKLGSLIPDQLAAAGVDVKALKISGYSGRKTTLQGGLESGIPGPYLAKVAGQKAYSSTGSYIRHEDASAKAMSMCISRRAGGDDETDFEQVLGGIRKSEKDGIVDKRKNTESISNLVEKPQEIKKSSSPSKDYRFPPHQQFNKPQPQQFKNPLHQQYNNPPHQLYGNPPDQHYNNPPHQQYSNPPDHQYNNPPPQLYNHLPQQQYPSYQRFNNLPWQQYNHPPQKQINNPQQQQLNYPLWQQYNHPPPQYSVPLQSQHYLAHSSQSNFSISSQFSTPHHHQNSQAHSTQFPMFQQPQSSYSMPQANQYQMSQQTNQYSMPPPKQHSMPTQANQYSMPPQFSTPPWSNQYSSSPQAHQYQMAQTMQYSKQQPFSQPPFPVGLKPSSQFQPIYKPELAVTRQTSSPAYPRQPSSPACSRQPSSPAGSRQPSSAAGSRQPSLAAGSSQQSSPAGSSQQSSPTGSRQSSSPAVSRQSSSPAVSRQSSTPPFGPQLLTSRKSRQSSAAGSRSSASSGTRRQKTSPAKQSPGTRTRTVPLAEVAAPFSSRQEEDKENMFGLNPKLCTANAEPLPTIELKANTNRQDHFLKMFIFYVIPISGAKVLRLETRC